MQDAEARAACCREPDAARAETVVATAREVVLPDLPTTRVLEEKLTAREECAKELRVKGPLERNLAELGQLCAPGMNAAGPGAKASGSAATADVTLNVSSRPMCFRAGALVSAGEVSLALVGPHGETLASLRSADSVGVLPSDGPFCVRETGVYHATAKVDAKASENAEVALRVWRTGREP
ncbi:MAG TPA: hypothetical protein VGL13_10045, partial [Polyangiaceae bacterium]